MSGVVLSSKTTSHMKKELVLDTISSLQKSWHLPKEIIFHSDCGSQYSPSEGMKLLSKPGFRQSFSRVGMPGDNSWSESFFSILKKELIFPIADSKVVSAPVRLSLNSSKVFIIQARFKNHLDITVRFGGFLTGLLLIINVLLNKLSEKWLTSIGKRPVERRQTRNTKAMQRILAKPVIRKMNCSS